LSCLQLEMANMRVERTFGWISHWGGVLRERAGRLDVATGRLACVASFLAAGALNNPS
jgi:hypothetical protein